MLVALNAGYAAIRYVNVNSSDPRSPYVSPEYAARAIQDAVNVSSDGDVIRVAAGTYNQGGAVAPGHGLTNRVMIPAAIRVESESGAASTIISGSGPYGPAAIRCVYMTNGAELIEFTLLGGHTMTNGDFLADRAGGGLLMDCGGFVSGCVVQANSANYGAGAFSAGGLIVDSTFANNAAVLSPASGGGAYLVYGALMERCVVDVNSGHYGAGVFCDLGGEVRDSRISRNNSAQNAGGIFCASGGLVRASIVTGNYARIAGGGAYCWNGGTIQNALILRNTATNGGGVCIIGDGRVQSCTIVTNKANAGGGLYCWGTGVVENTILYYNAAGYGPNIHHEYGGCSYWYSCMTPFMANGAGNTELAPFFVNRAASDYRLQVSSPCIDQGTNQSWMARQLDLDGRPRIWINRVDMGAYERNPASLDADTDGDGVPDWWEWIHFGHVTNVNAGQDYDGDGYLAGEEFIAGTEPTNSRSFLYLAIERSGQSGRYLWWPSAASRFYTVTAFTNLFPLSGDEVITNRMAATPPQNMIAITQNYERVYFRISVSR